MADDIPMTDQAARQGVKAAGPQEAEAAAGLSACQELGQHGHVLLMSLVSYVAIAGSWSFIPALIMHDITTQFDIAIGTWSTVMGAFLMIKAGLHIFAAGPAMEHVGAANLGVATLVVIGLLDLAAGFAVGRTTIFAALGAVNLLSAFGDQPTFICVNSQYFEKQLALATSTMAAGYSLAGTLLPPLLAPLLVAYSWRAVWITLAAISLLVAPCAHCVFRVPRKRNSTSAHDLLTAGEPKKAAASSAVPPVSFGELALQRRFWALMAAGVAVMVYGGLLSAHLPTILRTEAGLDVIRATSLYSFQYACAVVGKLLVGVTIDRLPRALVFTVAPTLYVLSHLLLVEVDTSLSTAVLFNAAGTVGPAILRISTSVPRLYAYCAVVGLSFGYTFSLLTCQPAQLFDRRKLPRVQSICFASLVLGLTLGNTLVGLMRDAYDSYIAALILTCATSIVAVVACLALISPDTLKAPATLI